MTRFYRKPFGMSIRKVAFIDVFFPERRFATGFDHVKAMNRQRSFRFPRSAGLQPALIM
jgi:hypothetical protein